MMQIAKIMPVNFRAAAAQQPLVSKPSEEKNADSNVSVSYTHLDVYKRQVQ